MKVLRNLLLSAVLPMLCAVQPIHSGDARTVTDMCGNKVEVPANPVNIACMHCVSPEKIMTLGRGDSISLMAEQSPWAYKLFPEIKRAQSNKNITLERMREMKIDFVLYTPGMTKGERYSSAGLKTVCAFSSATRPMTLQSFLDNYKQQISLFGELLGPAAKVRAERYNRYFDAKVRSILAVTSKIDRKKWPAVYYGGMRGDMLNGQGKGSIMHWNTEIAGGNFLAQALNDDHASATMQQVAAWDPDIILISGLAESMDVIKKNPDFASLRAVKKGKVFHLPQGIYPWDHASGENVLLMVHMAKLFHPDLFKNWDMVKEMKTFYGDVYGKTITDQDAERILQHLPPL